MELLTCPACGCSVQVADVLLGRRVRCFTCQHSFVAEARPAAPPPLRSETPPRPRSARRPHKDDDNTLEYGRDPFCPDCGRRITWRGRFCPYCGEELEPEDGPLPAWRRPIDLIRRDFEPHRGPLILSLGNISMIVGGLSLCTFGLGAVLSVPVGILAWQMASRDLRRMHDGLMDPDGKSQTETGRMGAIAGVILGAIFAAFYFLVLLVG